MTRIISGFAGSLSLAVPKQGTRPTSDRVREAIFSALEAQDALRRARVLDLYAGSGALGLEAASRGAASVTLVEKNQVAAGLCRRNVEAVRKAAPTRAAPDLRVSAQSVQTFLGSAAGRFDLVFLDPPYDLGDAELGRALAALVPLLSEDAVVVVERNVRSPEPAWDTALELTKRKDYGDTSVWYARMREQPPYTSVA